MLTSSSVKSISELNSKLVMTFKKNCVGHFVLVMQLRKTHHQLCVNIITTNATVGSYSELKY